MKHQMADHHARLIGYGAAGALYMRGCVCGAAGNDPLHGTPPCDWCLDAPDELGPASPWWFRAWCRFCAWLLLDKPKKK